MDAEIVESDKPVHCNEKLIIDKDSSSFFVISIEIDLKNLRDLYFESLVFRISNAIYLIDYFAGFRLESILKYHIQIYFAYWA